MGFYRVQNDHYFNKKRIVDMDVVNDVTSTRQNVSTRMVIRFLIHVQSHYKTNATKIKQQPCGSCCRTEHNLISLRLLYKQHMW